MAICLNTKNGNAVVPAIGSVKKFAIWGYFQVGSVAFTGKVFRQCRDCLSLGECPGFRSVIKICDRVVQFIDDIHSFTVWMEHKMAGA